MTQRNMGLIVCLLLLSTAVGCGKTTPSAEKTPAGETKTSTETTPSAGTTPSATTPIAGTTTQAGLKKIEGNGVELSVPEGYEGGNPSKDLDAIAAKLKAIGPDYEKRLEALKKDPSKISLLAFDPKVGKAGFLTNINVLPEKVPAGTTVEQYLQAAVKQLTGAYKVIDQKVVTIDQYKAGRIVAESTKGDTKIKQLFYAIPKGDTFWLVTYSTSNEEFDQRLPNFEQSVRSFVIKS